MFRFRLACDKVLRCGAVAFRMLFRLPLKFCNPDSFLVQSSAHICKGLFRNKLAKTGLIPFISPWCFGGCFSHSDYELSSDNSKTPFLSSFFTIYGMAMAAQRKSRGRYPRDLYHFLGCSFFANSSSFLSKGFDLMPTVRPFSSTSKL